MTPSRRPPPRKSPPVRSGRKRRAERRRSRRRIVLLLAVLVPVVAVVTAVGGTYAFGSSCDLGSLRPVTAGANSFVYAADGSLLGAIPAERNRTPVKRSHMSPWIAKATVAIEDRRFYRHGGIDPIGILRAVVADARARRIVEGGSTITQELVRNLYLSRTQTLSRKLVEACLAIKLSRSWSKDRILTAYLNEVYYGNHAYGIEAAAETYFSVPAAELSLEQAALLAGLPQAPSLYDPFHDPSAALARRNEVLYALRTNGDITGAQYISAVGDRSLQLKPGSAYSRIREPYFFGYVEEVLQEAYGANTVRSGGLKVYTTINPALQRVARAAITHVLTSRGDPASAIVAIDPRSGAIRAMEAVTPGNASNQFNFVTSAHRQPGSTFKTIALTAAVAAGMDPFSTYYLSAPFFYPPDDWQVSTYEHTYHGVESVASATVQSDNTVYARLSVDVGPERIAAMARRLGVRSPLDVKGAVPPSIALGSVGVTPLDMASAYATLAAGGIYSKPMAITKVILADGKVDGDTGWGKSQRERVIADWVAATVTKVLESNMLYGTGVGAHVSGHTDAGKTGTTDNYADAWFSGYTPLLEATVWMGYPKAEIPMLNVHGITVSGPTFPASIWHLFMSTVIGERKDVPFPEAKSEPKWQTWHGRYQYSGGYYTPATTATTTTSTAAATTSAATTTVQERPARPEPATTTAPATTTPPPSTTTVPPVTIEPATTVVTTTPLP
jgi:penicillin-binding protein 1A